MRSFLARCAVVSLVVAVATTSLVVAQVGAPGAGPGGGGTRGPAGSVDIKKIDGRKTIAPDYRVGGWPSEGRKREWFRIMAAYETADDWMDEVSLNYYVLVKSKTGRKQLLLRGRVTYVDVPRGSHLSDVYLHPNTILRYGDVEAIGVTVEVGGRLVAMESFPKSNKRWWEEASPQDGYVLQRTETPFAVLSLENDDAIKPTVTK